MRWLKKREIVAYYLLFSRFRLQDFSFIEAMTILYPYFSKKVSRNIILYLRKIGLIQPTRGSLYRLVDFGEFVLLDVGYDYLKRRSTLRRRTQ
ncbi:hypothetical protein [Sulfuracidifex tepidarius]|uniref:Uncharacterized protein n=1 Tax=Sulfuracidifex tepidarius TaxID=1294262 RepID=A0A510E3H0_9CREN|nr:hypothetical protein [Sulfuracidifex tepidarius]BBG23875.1 hypothetical protein IC006_1171 [Sulfuracidifex tepidarius]BBG26630.1 hypothetical protein IC007_1146 [Sulfuracidifex tepidarius]